MSVNTIETMIDWVENRLQRNPSLEEMSDFVGYSPFYCSTKFHEHVGFSLKEYVQKRKLAMAAQALRATEYRILDIALEYGFSSHEAFTRAFVKQYGYTPFQFRKQKPDVCIFERIYLKNQEKVPPNES